MKVRALLSACKFRLRLKNYIYKNYLQDIQNYSKTEGICALILQALHLHTFSYKTTLKLLL